MSTVLHRPLDFYYFNPASIRSSLYSLIVFRRSLPFSIVLLAFV